ncbi:MAG: hypothetical protein R2715_19790 [Ilumatobacteraceae bacterium]
MSTRLTKLDEWPRHQAGGTFDVVVDGSPHWSDGYYFTAGAPDGSATVFIGFRLYANNDVLDTFVVASVEGRQHNMRWSRRLRPQIDELVCGPVSVEIVEPLRVIRVVVGANDYGIELDLTWTGEAPPYNEERLITILNGRVHADRSNYDQCGRVDGMMTIGDRTIAVEEWSGVRDHSWGIGNQTGGPRSKAIAPDPDPPAPRGVRQWCVFRMRDRVLFWQFHSPASGGYSKFETRVTYAYGDERPASSWTAVEHEIVWATDESGRPVRRALGSTLAFTNEDGTIERYLVEAISQPVYLQGGGYFAGFDDGLGRGVYRGELHHEGEVWELDGPVGVHEPKGIMKLHADAYAEQWARCTNLDDPSDTGTGHLECVVLGPYPGFDQPS